jgi:pyruvate,water dikinase
VADLRSLGPDRRHEAGGKAIALGALHRAGLKVPEGLCILTRAYDHFVDRAGVRQAIALELGRKRFADMRWEEVWDASLRIRNLFLRAAADPESISVLEVALAPHFADGRPAVVRSSAPAEDTAATSFAGLHESYVNVRGVPALLDAVRRVWASLWSDRALLYRQELGLDILSSNMAVIVQELMTGQVSGIAFSQSPLDDTQAVVEAVWGLNEGLVDGTIEPDRWTLDRKTGLVLEHREPVRLQKVASAVTVGKDAAPQAGGSGTRLVPLPPAEKDSAPLTADMLRRVFEVAALAEEVFGTPQDVEWTVAGGDVWLLQSRPISTLGSRPQTDAEADAIARERAAAEFEEALGGSGARPAQSRPPRDERPWYLNLRKSFGTLRELRRRVEQVAIPAMKAEADAMAAVEPSTLSDSDLALEVKRRARSLSHWEEVYYRDFVPLAHGVRLFAQVYNDKVRPADPYEFIDLLTGSGLLSVERNAVLQDLARRHAGVAGNTKAGVETSGAADFEAALDDYLDRFGSGPATPEPVRKRERELLLGLLLEMARSPETVKAPVPGSAPPPPVDRAAQYLARFGGDERLFQEELLDLARASYRLRDDDNVHLDRIRRLAKAALVEAQAREQAAKTAEPRSGSAPSGRGDDAEVPSVGAETPSPPGGPVLKARQLVGQPAGPGLAVGRARVILETDDLFAFQRGEILVCDSLDPTMTFVAPLAAAIVERRGGMLVHGAIIAREYGLPCVTGVPDATQDIHTGDLLTVDGFLGIVVVGGAPPERAPADAAS